MHLGPLQFSIQKRRTDTRSTAIANYDGADLTVVIEIRSRPNASYLVATDPRSLGHSSNFCLPAKEACKGAVLNFPYSVEYYPK